MEGEKMGQWEQLEFTASKWEETEPGTEALFTSFQRGKPLLVVSWSWTRSSLLEQTKAA